MGKALDILKELGEVARLANIQEDNLKLLKSLHATWASSEYRDITLFDVNSPETAAHAQTDDDESMVCLFSAMARQICAYPTVKWEVSYKQHYIKIITTK